MSIDGIPERPASELIQFRTDIGQKVNGNHRPISSPKFQDQDEVELSENTKQFLKIRQVVDSLPDVRLDRINQLAKAIDKGTYNARAEQIADAIIEKNLIDYEV